VQKVFNVLSVASFLMSGAMVVGAVMLYTRIPSLTKYYMSELKVELTQLVTNMVPEQLEKAMPKLPAQTGLPVRLP